MGFFRSLIRCKSHDHAYHDHPPLKQVLSATDLTLLGIGAIIGAGVFVLTGIASALYAGPAVVLSYIIAAIACAFSAFSYAELSASIGGCGSAYGYTYVGLGELMAWLIGWDLILEYGLIVSTVSVGWSGYAVTALKAIGINIPIWLCEGPLQHGIVNLPAVLIIVCVGLLLLAGTKQSARFNNIIVTIKAAAILLFIGVAAFHFNLNNWHPFMPFGFHGVITGAALIFFAFIGFDAVSTAAEETINPQRNLPIGIIASLAVCTVLYVAVAGLLTGIAHYTTLNNSSPVATALIHLGQRTAAGMISIGAIAGLTTVVMVIFFGLTRIFLAMSRDGLLPSAMAKVSPKTHTPTKVIIVAGVIMAVMAGFLPISALAELVNLGTLAAFTLVCLSVIIMRYTKPDLKRPFRTPWSPLVPACGVALNLYLMFSLPLITWIYFSAWAVIGLVIYFMFSRKNSILAKTAS